MGRARSIAAIGMIACMATLVFARTSGSWLSHVPSSVKYRTNPFANQTDAQKAGAKLFEQHCAQCHGSDAEGKYDKPGLHSRRVKQATDGELEWLLVNGSLVKGMPSWSRLPQAERWQLVTYLRSLSLPPSDVRP